MGFQVDTPGAAIIELKHTVLPSTCNCRWTLPQTKAPAIERLAGVGREKETGRMAASVVTVLRLGSQPPFGELHRLLDADPPNSYLPSFNAR